MGVRVRARIRVRVRVRGSVLPLAKVTLLRVGVRVGVWLGG